MSECLGKLRDDALDCVIDPQSGRLAAIVGLVRALGSEWYRAGKPNWEKRLRGLLRTTDYRRLRKETHA